MKSLLLIALLPLASCVSYKDGFGGELASLGGSATAEFPSGGRITHSHTRSFQHATQAVIAVAAGVVSSVNLRSDNNLSATQSTNAAGVTKNAADNVTKQAAIKATPTVVVPPATAVFPPQ